MNTPDTIFAPSIATDEYGRISRSPDRYKRKIIIASLSDKAYDDISSQVTRASINYSISMASELSFDVIDVDLRMAKKNYFILGRDVIYETHTLGQINARTGGIKPIQQIFEISDVSVSQGPGGSAVYSLKCYSKATQQMKRDKQPGSIPGSGSQFIINAAKKYGLDFYCENTTKGKTTTKASGSKQTESLWDVMLRMAGDAKFVLFEVDGILVFASEKYLLSKWGTDTLKVDLSGFDPKAKKTKSTPFTLRFIPLQWPNSGPDYVGKSGYFRLMERPTITKKANDPYAAEGSCSVERFNGTQIRPGMTAYVGNVPHMSGYYLVESVSFNEMTPDPVSVGFRTLTRDEETEKIELLPIGVTYQQTFIAGEKIKTTVEQNAILNMPQIKFSFADKRITGANLPDANNVYRYPEMPYANISRTYAAEKGPMPASTNDFNSLIITGNLDLYNRPLYVVRNKKNEVIEWRTIHSITHVVQAGSEYRAIVLPSVFTENGTSVMKTNDEIIDRYNADGGYAGSAKHLGVLRGNTFEDAVRNARDYGYLLSIQSFWVFVVKIPNFNEKKLVNTPGGSDSNW